MYLGAGRQLGLDAVDLVFSLTGPITITQTRPVQSTSTVTTTTTFVAPSITFSSLSTPTPSSATGVAPSNGILSPPIVDPAEVSIPVPAVSVVNVAPTVASPGPTALAGTSALQSPGIPKGAIAAIVILLVIVIGIAAVFTVRAVHQRNRARKRKHVNSFMAISSSGGIMGGPATGGGSIPASRIPNTFSGPEMYQAVPPPQSTYLNTVGPSSSNYGVSYSQAPYLAPPPIPVPNAPASVPTKRATVLKSFIPTLPDELSILSGERVIVLTVFDDGWALCRRSSTRDDEGMVPLECLEMDEVSDYQPSLAGSRRLSSLSRL